MTADEKAKNQTQEYEVKKAPDGGYGWVVLVAAFLVSFILDGIMYPFGIILNEIKQNVEGEKSHFNLMSSFNTGFLFCSGPIVAGLTNQFGCRTVVMIGSLVTAAMYVLTAFTTNLFVMMAAYGIIGGLSTGCTYLASLIVIPEYFDKKKGIATGITMAGSGLGSFVLPPLINFIIEKMDWRFTMSICACFILQTCVCGALLRPLNPTGSQRNSSPKNSKKQLEMKSLNDTHEAHAQPPQHQHVEHGKEAMVQTYFGSVYSLNEIHVPFYERNTFLRIVVGILKEMTDFSLLTQNFRFLLITLSNLIVFTGYFTPFLYLTKCVESNGIDKDSAAFLISIIGIVNIPFRMLFGFVADRGFLSAVDLNTFSVLLCTAALFFFELMSKLYLTNVVFVVIFAIGMAGMNCLTTSYLCELVGLKKFGNATGIINLFRGFGCFLGPFIAGQIEEKFDPFKCFYFSAICFSIGLVLTLLVSLTRKCCKNSNDDDTTLEVVKSVDESDLNKNLLRNKA